MQTSSRAAQSVRPEIQGLRAVAVVAVLLFHVWPDWLPGGYVGVDVFFVISGFLITSLLLRELERDARIDFRRFYLRRIRRLLPAASVVLAVVAVLTPLFLPAALWKDTAMEILASAFYVENWRLAHMAIDYLGSENDPSPLKHYWSLSIEEQFYIFWPALIAVLAWAARAAGMPLRRCLRTAFAATIAVSLWLSVSLTNADPASGYFVTHTRIWELALGGLVAVSHVPVWRRARDMMGLIGMSCIALAAVRFDATTVFPGYAALLPTMGAVLIIVAGDGRSWFSAYGLLATKPFRWMGDASYSIYLWHWPIVVFYLAETGADKIGPMAGVALILATLGLSWFSKLHIEDRFRHGQADGNSYRLPALRYVGGALVPVVAAVALLGFVARAEAELQRKRDLYSGAKVLTMESAPAELDDYIPSLSALKSDRATVYDNGCHLGFHESVPVACRYGSPKGKFKVFLVGDSHAANWIPALEGAAERQDWNAFSFTKSSCPLSSVMMGRAGKAYEECFSWGKQVRKIIAEERPDLVILAQMYSAQPWHEKGEAQPSMRMAVIDLWREIMSTGAQVVVVADTPRWRNRSPDGCLAADRWCQVKLRQVSVSRRDPLVAAQRQERSVGLVDFNDLLCPGGQCPVVIGNVVVWRDRHHLTATYSRSMADYFTERVEKAMADARARSSTHASTTARQ